ncbi:MAG: hypothetical protein RL171_902 [Pseudomonadota bacterium]
MGCYRHDGLAEDFCDALIDLIFLQRVALQSAAPSRLQLFAHEEVLKMARYNLNTQTTVSQRHRPVVARLHWMPKHAGWVASLTLASLAWWAWPQSTDKLAETAVHAATDQTAQPQQQKPVDQSADQASVSTSASNQASIWSRLAQAEEFYDDQSPDPRTRNAAIDPIQLAAHHPLKARAFLDNVVLLAEPRGGFLVESVLAGSQHERAGLKAGDTIYSLELPGQTLVDETNMVALTSVSILAFDVVRQGALVRLSTGLSDEVATHATP